MLKTRISADQRKIIITDYYIRRSEWGVLLHIYPLYLLWLGWIEVSHFAADSLHFQEDAYGSSVGLHSPELQNPFCPVSKDTLKIFLLMWNIILKVDGLIIYPNILRATYIKS